MALIGRLAGGGAAALLALLLPGCGVGQPAPPAQHCAAPVFDEEFDAPPSFFDPVANSAGRWKSNFFFGIQPANDPNGWTSRTIAVNHEQQYYAPPPAAAGGTGSIEWHDGMLDLVARPNADQGDPRTGRLPYVSGLVTTEPSFHMQTGYVEARIALPPGKGLWPAFWMLPVPAVRDGAPVEPGKQEIDILEAVGEPGRTYHTIFTDEGGAKVRDSYAFDSGADLTRFHVYGLLIRADQIAWYFDGRLVRTAPNIDFHRPAYLLLNLAVGGDWPGAPDGATAFPARMTIDWIRAYELPHGKSC